MTEKVEEKENCRYNCSLTTFVIRYKWKKKLPESTVRLHAPLVLPPSFALSSPVFCSPCPSNCLATVTVGVGWWGCCWWQGEGPLTWSRTSSCGMFAASSGTSVRTDSDSEGLWSNKGTNCANKRVFEISERRIIHWIYCPMPAWSDPKNERSAYQFMSVNWLPIKLCSHSGKRYLGPSLQDMPSSLSWRACLLHPAAANLRLKVIPHPSFSGLVSWGCLLPGWHL